MNDHSPGTDSAFEERLSRADRLGDPCPVATCSGYLDLVYG